ncbi:MAG: UbiD family decarboxylase, partial [Phycisphaerae bacterium]|nr:UbiD family decarboxylase [Phycisphaerae bacterium]
MFPTLGAFLGALERAGELHRIRCPVSPVLEVAEIADRAARMVAPHASRGARAFDPAMARMGGKALLFEQVQGSDFALAINVYGSYARMETALGCAQHERGFESIADRIGALVKPELPRSIGETLAKAREFAPLLRIGPKRVRRGPCQEVVKLAERGEVDLTRLPIIKCWPLDGDPAAVGSDMTAEAAGTAGGGGRFITLAGMHTVHADDRDAERPASHNIGMYRSQLLGPTRLAMHWHVHHDGASHWRSWKALGKRMPIAICFGGESVLPYGATAPLPPGISELLMCGFLNGRGVPMVRAKTVPLWVPANSEIVIEGWVSTECGTVDWQPEGNEPLGPGAVFEGPFGDHTGFYSLPDRYPIVEVTAMTHRRHAVYPTTIVGLPPQEDYYLGKCTERVFLPLLRTLIHDVDDYHLPQFGCFHNAAFVRIRKAYALQARRVMSSVWGAGQMAWTKMVFVFDHDAPIHDEDAAMRTLFARCDFLRDTMTVQGPLDILDHAAPWLGAGTKIGFDCTAKVTGEAWNGVPLGDPSVPTAEQIAACRAAIVRACTA